MSGAVCAGDVPAPGAPRESSARRSRPVVGLLPLGEPSACPVHRRRDHQRRRSRRGHQLARHGSRPASQPRTLLPSPVVGRSAVVADHRGQYRLRDPLLAGLPPAPAHPYRTGTAARSGRCHLDGQFGRRSRRRNRRARRLARISRHRVLTAGYLAFGTGLGLNAFAGSLPEFVLAAIVWASADLMIIGCLPAMIAEIAPAGSCAELAGTTDAAAVSVLRQGPDITHVPADRVRRQPPLSRDMVLKLRDGLGCPRRHGAGRASPYGGRAGPGCGSRTRARFPA
jgi:hypothetical protein